MNRHLVWTNAGTAIVSFALGWALTPKSNQSQGDAVTGSQSAKSRHSISSDRPAAASEEMTGRTQVAKRDENKKPTVPKIAIPLTTIAEMIKAEQGGADFGFHQLRNTIKKSLQLLGTSESETQEVLALLERTNSEISEQETKLIKVEKTGAGVIQMNNQAMEAFSKTLAPKIQQGIRASMPADLAEVLISSTTWDRLYPTGKGSFPTFSITRTSPSKVIAAFNVLGREMASDIRSEYPDDGTPIPADRVFKYSHWKPFLKGLTLLPQNEE